MGELEKDVRYVSDDLEDEMDDEFVKECDKLLELEITECVVSTFLQGSSFVNINSHVVELALAMSEAKVACVEGVAVECDVTDDDDWDTREDELVSEAISTRVGNASEAAFEDNGDAAVVGGSDGVAEYVRTA